MERNINVWGYLDEYAEEREDIMRAVTEVFESGKLILGPKVRQFEQEYAHYVGMRHGIGCDNGTNAIVLALRGLGVGEGDEVITVSNTAIPTVSAIVTCGAKPVFVDIDPDTYLMDVSKLESAITEHTKCILPVHLYGQAVDMDPLLLIAHQYNLKVIEDCAQAHGTLYKGRVAGSMSDASATSFYPTKVLGAYGDGGMILTDSDDLDARLRRLRFYGTEGNYYAQEHGYNCRLDELQASILLTKLQHLEQYVARRRDIAQQYNQMLASTGLKLPHEAAYGRHSYYLYVVRHPERDRIISELHQHGIHVNISYPWPIHTMPAYRYLGYTEGSLPETEKAAREIFSLPMYPSLRDQDIARVCEVLTQICGL